MDALLDSIRVAMGDGASDDERQRGALACRALAEALEGAIVVAPPAAPMLDPVATLLPSITPETTAVSPFSLGPVALAPNPFAGLTADQILDLAIAKLRRAVGDEPPPPLGLPFRLTLVPVPRIS